MEYVILTHGSPGGASSPRSDSDGSDGCIAAAEIAREALIRGGDALEAAALATAAIEDDPRFHAEPAANPRAGDQPLELDAAVMASDGRFGAVACIEHVQNPVLVAARVLETPHLLLCGPGATAFARARGFPERDPAASAARARHARAAAVVRDGHGRFAAAASTGGALVTLPGRVGDVPLPGAGLFAGPEGAVAAIGLGEEIARRLLARAVYEWLAEGLPPARAAQRALTLFPDIVDVGVLVVGRAGQTIAANRGVTYAQLVGGVA